MPNKNHAGADHCVVELVDPMKSPEALGWLLALQLRFWKMSESMGNHDSEVVDASSVD